MTYEEYGTMLYKLWNARVYVVSTEDTIRCERLVFHWLCLGVTAFGVVSRETSDHVDDCGCMYFKFDNQTWGFTNTGNWFMYRYVEIADSFLWTSGLLAKIAAHFELANACGLTVEDTANALDLLGVGAHPIPESDEDMLQKILEARGEE